MKKMNLKFEAMIFIIVMAVLAGLFISNSLSVYTSSYGSSISYLNITYGIICPGNTLMVNATSGGESTSEPVNSVTIDIIQLEPVFNKVGSNDTNLAGYVTFELKKNGAYEIDASRPGFLKPASIFFNFTLCKVEPKAVPAPKNTSEEKLQNITANETVQNATMPPAMPEEVQNTEKKEEPKIIEQKQAEPAQTKQGLDPGIFFIAIIAIAIVLAVVLGLSKSEGNK